MFVHINGQRLRRFSIPIEYRLPRDMLTSRQGMSIEDDWAHEEIAKHHPVRWWIGFTPKPLDEESLRGVSVLARHKLVQRPFLFDRSQGAQGQLGQEYIVGEVEAHWLDNGRDIEDDLLQANKDQLQLEDDRLTEFLLWGRRLVEWSLRERIKLRDRDSAKTFEDDPRVQAILKPFTPHERRSLRSVHRAIIRLEGSPQQAQDLLSEIANGYQDQSVRALIQEIELQDPALQGKFWSLVREFSLIDARRTYSIIQARLKTIERLRESVEHGVREVPDLHRIILEDPWLIDPRWTLLNDEVDLSEIVTDFTPETEGETGRQLDYLFALRPSQPAPTDEIAVVEIKRGKDKDGSPRKASLPEVDKFADYVVAVDQQFPSARVHGLMIAEGFTKQAETKRKLYRSLPVPSMEFEPWQSVISKTERLHLSWLGVTRRRATIADQ